MARNPELEAILQARYELERCEPGQKTERRTRLDALIQEVLARRTNRSLTPRAVIEITAGPYHEYKLARWKAERARLSRVRKAGTLRAQACMKRGLTSSIES